jgi:hypothetical protein
MCIPNHGLQSTGLRIVESSSDKKKKIIGDESMLHALRLTRHVYCSSICLTVSKPSTQLADEDTNYRTRTSYNSSYSPYPMHIRPRVVINSVDVVNF